MTENNEHPDLEVLTALAAGDAGVDPSLAEHLQSCAPCAMRQTRIAQVINVMRNDATEEVPSHVLERTFDLFQQRPAAETQRPVPGFLDRITAVLREETSSLMPAFGLRSGDVTPQRRLWLTARDVDIDLSLRRMDGHWEISGQVFSAEIGGKAKLTAEGHEDRTTEISDLGDFAFSGVADGVYTLLVTFDQTVIEIPNIQVVV